MTKSEYRKIYKEMRLALTPQQTALFDNALLHQLTKLDLSGVKYLHTYISIRRFNEPDTLQFMDYLRANFPELNIVISRSDFENNSMINYVWNASVKLEENKWGILEPNDGHLVDEKLIDLVLIPLLIADKKGNRVGYGKGFYDRFLLKCKPSIQKIGISYFEPVEEIEDVAHWDVPLDSLITPTNRFIF